MSLSRNEADLASVSCLGQGRQAGRHQADGGRRGGPWLALQSALSEHGYEPRYDDAGILRMRNCPFRHLAELQPEVICHMNLALIQGLAADLGADDLNPVLDPEPGHCCVAIPTAKHEMSGTT